MKNSRQLDRSMNKIINKIFMESAPDNFDQVPSQTSLSGLKDLYENFRQFLPDISIETGPGEQPETSISGQKISELWNKAKNGGFGSIGIETGPGEQPENVGVSALGRKIKDDFDNGPLGHMWAGVRDNMNVRLAQHKAAWGDSEAQAWLDNRKSLANSDQLDLMRQSKLERDQELFKRKLAMTRADEMDGINSADQQGKIPVTDKITSRWDSLSIPEKIGIGAGTAAIPAGLLYAAIRYSRKNKKK